jgi:hypothetical protein
MRIGPWSHGMTTVQRLAAVERQLCFHRAVITGLLIALVAFVGYGATQALPEVIQAKRFEVLNDEGRIMVVLNSWEHGGQVSTFSAEGQHHPLVMLTYTSTGEGHIIVGNRDGRNLATLGANVSGNGVLTVSRKDGVQGVTVQGKNTTGGGGAVLVSNKTGHIVGIMAADEDGLGWLGVYDPEGNTYRKLAPK